MSNNLAFVIEDDFDGSMVFAKALEANGLAPEQIMSGNQALDRLAASVPTLVILDLHLPVVPGPDILRKMRADDRLNDTLVVVVTADPRMADMIREDADLVLLKPTTFSQVRDLVGRLMAVRGRSSKPDEEPAPPEPAPEPVAAEPAAPARPDPVPVAEELAVVSTKPVPEPEAVEPAVASAKADPAPEVEPAPVPAEPDPAPAPAARSSSGRGSGRGHRK